MRELTFEGFLKKYVQSLSVSGSTSVFKLAREATTDNPRLREPLLLYALYTDKADLLFRATKGTELGAQYYALLHSYTKQQMTRALKQSSESLPREYLKVWKSYYTRSHKHETENEVKALVREQVLREQKARGFSTYRLYTDLHLNAGNLNAWLRTGDDTKVSLTAAKRTLDYARQL